jgi:cytoskeletal protein CcmA (bactofilin family)
MKRIKIVSLGLLASFVIAIGTAGIVSASWSPNFQTSNDAVTLAKDKVHEGSFYVAGSDVTIDGTIKGTLYCAGSVITINGSVEGDVLCAGQDININGIVGGDVRAAGQFVRVDGTIQGSLSALAQDVRLDASASVGGDVNGASQQFTLNGTVGRDVAVGTQTLTLGGEVKGNVDAGVEQLRMSSDVAVLGNLNYSADKEQSFDTALVQGDVSFNPSDAASRHDSRALFGAMTVIFLFMSAVSALVIVLIMPRFVNRSSELFRRQMLLTILLGFAFVVGAPVVAGLLMFSVVMAPIGFALLAGWIAVLALSNALFAYWVGAELLRSQPNAVVRMLGGVAVLSIAYMIPVLNGLVLFAAVMVGSGIIITTLSNGYKRPSYNTAAKAKSKTAK